MVIGNLKRKISNLESEQSTHECDNEGYKFQCLSRMQEAQVKSFCKNELFKKVQFICSCKIINS